MNKPQYSCPACKTELAWDPKNPNRPFCSDTCKNKDFIDWANQEHSIAGSPTFDDIMSEQLDAETLAILKDNVHKLY